MQALFLMNDPLAHGVAARIRPARSRRAHGRSRRGSLLAYQLALNRSPNPEEQQDCAEFLQTVSRKLTTLKTPADQLELQTWAALARALMSGNEFVFVD